MKLTNKFNYHDIVVRAIRNDTYSKGDSEFSATGLIAPARIRVLTQLNQDDLVVDIDDEIFKLYGQMGHAILERSGNELEFVTEKRLFAEFEGTRISAQIDSLSLIDGCLTDWKFTTVYGFMKGSSPKPEWVYQLNIQKYILDENAIDSTRLQIVGLLRDWRPREAEKQSLYPTKVASHKIPIMRREDIESYIRARIKAHRDADENLPKCTPDENWQGRRCSGYCQVSKFCSQFQSTIKKKELA